MQQLSVTIKQRVLVPIYVAVSTEFVAGFVEWRKAGLVVFGQHLQHAGLPSLSHELRQYALLGRWVVIHAGFNLYFRNGHKIN